MSNAAVEAHWNDHIIVDRWGNSVFKQDTPGCHYCDALSGRLARHHAAKVAERVARARADALADGEAGTC